MAKSAKKKLTDLDYEEGVKAAIAAGNVVIYPQPGPQTQFAMSPADIVFFGGQAGGGKMLDIHTLIPTVDGWRSMLTIRVGDRVFDENGIPCTVTHVHPVDLNPESYLVRFDDGVEIKACADHQWLTYTASDLAAMTRLDPEWRARRRAKRPSRANGGNGAAYTAQLAKRNSERAYVYKDVPTGGVKTTREIAATLTVRNGTRANHAIPMQKPLDLPARLLPIDPYVLGLWLGDGTSQSGHITTIDDQILEEIRTVGFEVVSVPSSKYAYNIRGLSPHLRRLGILGNKCIPQEYLRASFEQRLALLQGLMDTDGHACESGSSEFITVDPVLRDNMMELLASLGIRSNYTTGIAKLNGKDCGPKYRFHFTTSLPTFRLKRKLDRQDRGARRRTTSFRYIVAVDPIDPIPMRCISVDSPSRLYLAGEHFVPTHNSYALLMEAARYKDKPGYTGVIFRRNLVDVRQPGGLLDVSQNIYSNIGGKLTQSPDTRWKFFNDKGQAISDLRFAHLSEEKTVYSWQGSQLVFIGFDEITHFTRKQFFYMLSRLRAGMGEGMRPYVRATCNPDADSWVAEFIDWWIDKNGYPIPDHCGKLRWFVNKSNKLDWFDSKEAAVAKHPGSRPKSVTFIPSKLSDNKILEDRDPDYRGNLEALDPVEKARLLEGNWKIRPAPGLYFQRDWCGLIDASQIPNVDIQWVRAWDLAATPKTEGNDPDWTAGVKMGLLPNGMLIVADCYMFREGPGVVEEQVLNTAMWDGSEVVISIPQDPGQAGVGQKNTYLNLLAGYDIRSHAVTQKNAKITRFAAFSAQVDQKRVLVVRDEPGKRWNEQWFACLEAFPSKAHDDAVDATSEAFHRLVTMPRRRGIAMGTIRT
ncbi:phage terminase large subunit [Methylosinus sp. PW1]|uniref:phage terminase large subunit n=1 Tax=Methylosinus sp. PW1 TaxID=107636 RepID=UPI000690BC46|nr:phage terminase large subunit [Methylosinus sp. PW1]